MNIIKNKPLIVYSEKLDKEYTLYETKVKLRGEGVKILYYFSCNEQRENNSMGYEIRAVPLPNNYHLVENERNGFITVVRNK